MANKFIREIRELNCVRCGYVWNALTKHPVKCPNSKCQAQLKRFPPKIKITRIETKTIKKILTL